MTSKVVNYDEWVVWHRQTDQEREQPLLLMLHGWTGDEKSMSIFSVRIPYDYFVISPRGPFNSPSGGFSWTRNNKSFDKLSALDFSEAIDGLDRLLITRYFQHSKIDNLSLLGFSQGAALAFTYTVLFPERVNCVAGLSGFLPYDLAQMNNNEPLTGKKVFLAHGLRDELVPIERAREDARMLESLGAHVIYCEDDVGHKTSIDCFRGLGEYFRNCLSLQYSMNDK